jgi:hypothetical protein
VLAIDVDEGLLREGGIRRPTLAILATLEHPQAAERRQTRLDAGSFRNFSDPVAAVIRSIAAISAA